MLLSQWREPIGIGHSLSEEELGLLATIGATSGMLSSSCYSETKLVELGFLRRSGKCVSITRAGRLRLATERSLQRRHA